MLTVQIYNLENGQGDYRYSVFVNRKEIASGTVQGHREDDGWAKLVRLVADEHIKAGFTGLRAREITPRDLVACGAQKNGRVCMVPVPTSDGAAKADMHEHKFVRIVPARQRGVNR
jgi:hypothetical protein